MQPGKIRCGRIVHFRSKEPNKTHPTIADFININVTSANKKWGNLSPMKLGPFIIEEGLHKYPSTDPYYPIGVEPGFSLSDDGSNQRATVTNLENYYQGSKILDIDLTSVDGKTVVKKEFFIRRGKLMHDPQPHRRPVPKSVGSPVASCFDGIFYNYYGSRYIYCYLYEQLVTLTPEYKELYDLLHSGTNLHVIGYDGFDIGEVNEMNLKNAYLDKSRPFGHELVLCSLLSNIRPWDLLQLSIASEIIE